MPEKLFNLFLKSRGYTPDYLNTINMAGNRQLKNISQLCAILNQIHDSQQKIVIMPDFDCDGISSGTVGFAGLCQLGFNVGLYMPHPEQGYGIKIADIDRVLQSYPDVKWLITCDVGQTCYAAFKYAYSKGLKVLVTDHHEQTYAKEPLQCEIVVNPCQFDEPYNKNRPDPNFNICGAYVLYQVLYHYTKQYQPDQLNLISALGVFAGIGTVGDMMPLIQENRLLIKFTVDMLNYLHDTPDLNMVLAGVNPIYFRAFNGLSLWLKVLEKEHKIFGNIDEDFLGYTLIPMFNSVKRMNLPMTLVFSVFFSPDPQKQAEYAEDLVIANDQRKIKVKSYMGRIEQEVIDHKQPYAPYFYFTDADSGILGLIANQIKNTLRVPVFVLNRQNLAGSGRSYFYFPVVKMCQKTEFKAQGHNSAFGISFKDFNQFERFYKLVVNTLPPLVEKYRHLKPTYDLKLVTRSNQGLPILTSANGSEFVTDAKQLKPYGQGFKEPDLAIGVFSNQADFRTMGKNKQHLKIILPGNIELISWNNAKELDELNDTSSFIFHGNLGINHFKGKDTLQMIGNLAPKNKH